jgi:hypothetical protein
MTIIGITYKPSRRKAGICFEVGRKIKPVIASTAKQSSATAPKAGLLRYARNDSCGKRFVQIPHVALTLIDRYLPAFQFRERHELIAEAAPASLLDAVTLPGVTEDPWTQVFIRVREWPDRLIGAFGGTAGLKDRAGFGIADFTKLGRDADRELAYGLIGRFWQSDYGLVAFDNAAQFDSFDGVGLAKLVLNFTTETLADGRTRLMTETRVFCTDRRAILRFTPYWWLIRPVSGLIRRRLLARIRDAARALARQ